ncbi:MAG TPA: hypothetical protein VN452_08160 [Longilinea sp.]|nr:hypothetical protein [Longilinea sp.]
MRLRWLPILLVTVILFTVLPMKSVQAVRGIPGSADFGYGARINLYGPQFEQALQLAGTLRLDWLTIDLSWAALMPDPTAPVDFSRLDLTMKTAAQNQTSVLFSITQPPTWALTAQGPNPNLAAVLVQMLAARYPDCFQAVELFPGANTAAGWGTIPDPVAYWNVFQIVKSKLHDNGISLELIAGGLEIADNQTAGTINELDFLRGLYQAGAINNLPVISLRFSDITGQPSDAFMDAETRVLRRYESVRQVMIDYNQGNSLLWITRLSVPDGTINPGEVSSKEPGQQSIWLTQAAAQLRAQLYVGMVVFGDLNAADPNQPQSKSTNLSAGSHPFTKALREIIQQSYTGNLTTTPGRAKSDAFIKLRT